MSVSMGIYPENNNKSSCLRRNWTQLLLVYVGHTIRGTPGRKKIPGFSARNRGFGGLRRDQITDNL